MELRLRHLHGWVKEVEVVCDDDLCFVGDHESYDEIIVKGTPPMHVRFEGGTAGDPATVGVLVNGISKVFEGNPGLITMVDGPVHRAFGSILP